MLFTLLKDFTENNSVHFHSQAKLMRSSLKSIRRGGSLPSSGSLVFSEQTTKVSHLFFPWDLGMSLCLRGASSQSFESAKLSALQMWQNLVEFSVGSVRDPCHLSSQIECFTQAHTEQQVKAMPLQFKQALLRATCQVSDTALSARKTKTLTLKNCGLPVAKAV